MWVAGHILVYSDLTKVDGDHFTAYSIFFKKMGDMFINKNQKEENF